MRHHPSHHERRASLSDEPDEPHGFIDGGPCLPGAAHPAVQVDVNAHRFAMGLGELFGGESDTLGANAFLARVGASRRPDAE